MSCQVINLNENTSEEKLQFSYYLKILMIYPHENETSKTYYYLDFLPETLERLYLSNPRKINYPLVLNNLPTSLKELHYEFNGKLIINNCHLKKLYVNHDNFEMNFSSTEELIINDDFFRNVNILEFLNNIGDDKYNFAEKISVRLRPKDEINELINQTKIHEKYHCQCLANELEYLSTFIFEKLK